MREFRQEKGRTSKAQVWKIGRFGSNVKMIWGQLDGAMQETTQNFVAINVGKANEKKPSDVAQDWMERQILLRTRKGYKEVDLQGNYLHGDEVKVGKETIKHGNEISFKELPQNLRFYKPQNSMNVYIEKLAAAGKALFLRKRNGNMFVLTIDEDGNPHLFSSSLAACPKGEDVPWIKRFPHLESDIREIRLAPKSIFLCELVSEIYHDDLDYVGSVLRSKTDYAIKFQSENHPVCLAVWDIAYYDGEQYLGKIRVGARQTLLKGFFPGGLGYLTHVESYKKGDPIPTGDGRGACFDGSLALASTAAKGNGWEGFVVVDPDADYGDRGVSWHGKADRPKECVKHKPKYEADFILRWDPDNGVGTWGKGKKSQGVGAFFAYLLNDEGDEVFVSKVGGGLTDDDVKKYAEPGICFVAQVEFASVTKDGSLQFPEFVRPRPDKTINECTFDQLPKAAEEEG